jgi:hypothetical protein
MFNTIGGAGAASRYGSGSDQMMRLLAAPAPQHWKKENRKKLYNVLNCVQLWLAISCGSLRRSHRNTAPQNKKILRYLSSGLKRSSVKSVLLLLLLPQTPSAAVDFFAATSSGC